MKQRKSDRRAYDVQCGDGTGGRVGAASPDEAREMAQEMCAVHDGVKEEPTPRE